MSRRNKLLRCLNIFMFLVAVLSCVQDDDYATPSITLIDPNITPNMTFLNVIARYNDAVANGESVGIFDDNDTELYIEGYIISSDKSGNFFEELIIQNKIDGSTDISDPRLGLLIDINTRNLSDTYEIGRKVYIKMNGLAIEESRGVYTIGKAVGNSLSQIQDYEYKNIIIRDSVVATLTPKITTISELTNADENTLIQLDNMQVHRNNIALTYAGEANDEFDGFRTLVSCDGGRSITLQTSTFADFKSVKLPELKGSVKGIFSRDFGDNINVFIINSSADITFDNPDRCDPDLLECDGLTTTSITIFEQNFQSIGNESDLDAMGWTNINVSGGNERFEDSSFSGDTFMKISAFGTNENPLEAWLVTPAINLDGSTEEELTFNVSSNFDTGQVLTAFITDNYTGDPTTTEWVQLDANIPIGDSGFGDFVQSKINISCLNGDVHVAFQYLGASGGAETRYHIDDIKVTGN